MHGLTQKPPSSTSRPAGLSRRRPRRAAGAAVLRRLPAAAAAVPGGTSPPSSGPVACSAQQSRRDGVKSAMRAQLPCPAGGRRRRREAGRGGSGSCAFPAGKAPCPAWARGGPRSGQVLAGVVAAPCSLRCLPSAWQLPALRCPSAADVSLGEFVPTPQCPGPISPG